MFGGLGDMEAQLGVVVAGLAGGALDDGAVSGDAARDALLMFSRLASLAETGRALTLAWLDRQGSCEAEFGLTAASWLAREAGLPKSTARRELRTGRALRDLPVVASAVISGSLDVEHARAMGTALNDRVREPFAEVQAEVVPPRRPDRPRNLAGLCRYHHGITHRKGWEMHTTDDGWHWWRSPTGRTFWSQRHQRRRTGPTPGDDPPADEPATPEAA